MNCLRTGGLLGVAFFGLLLADDFWLHLCGTRFDGLDFFGPWGHHMYDDLIWSPLDGDTLGKVDQLSHMECILLITNFTKP